MRHDTKANLARRTLAALALAIGVSVLAGCETPGAAVAPSGLAPGAEAGFVVEDLALSSERLVGAEAFAATLKVRVPAGRFVKAVGIKTPYESTVRTLKRPLPMAIQDGWVILRTVHFDRTPVAGPYPFEIWLINEAGEESNRVSGMVVVQ